MSVAVVGGNSDPSLSIQASKQCSLESRTSLRMTLSLGVVCEGFTCQELQVSSRTAYAAGAHFWRIALTWGVLCLRRCKSYGLPVGSGRP